MRLLDGPGAGKDFMVRRCPLFLRAVESATLVPGEGEWDVLDMPNDAPGDHEQIWIYRRVTAASRCHVNWGRGRGGFYEMADYRYVEATDDLRERLRDNGTWRQWCCMRRDSERQAAAT